MNTSFWENIHFGRVVICFGVNRMIIHFSKASDPPSCPYSIHIFLQKILVENSLCSKELNQFSPPNSSDDLCLLTLSVFYGENRFPLLLYLKMARGMPRARECSLRALVFRLPYCPTIRPYMPAPPPLIIPSMVPPPPAHIWSQGPVGGSLQPALHTHAHTHHADSFMLSV